MRLRDTLGGPSVTQLFVHCVASQRHRARSARDRRHFAPYPERALLLARAHDVVCVGHPVDEDYLAFLGELDVGPRPGNIVAAEGRRGSRAATLVEALLATPAALERVAERLAGAHRVILNPFILTAGEGALGARLTTALGREVRLPGGDPGFVDRANQKHVVRERALALGVPLAPGETVELAASRNGRPGHAARLLEAVDRQRRRTGRALVRGSRGSSGSSTRILDGDRARARRALASLASRDENRVYLVEPFIALRTSPNVLLHVAEGAGPAPWVCVTDQLLDERLAYEGSLFPSDAATVAAMVEAARRLAGWLRAEGYEGPAGFDFGELADPAPGEPPFFLAELNLRTNGASYPAGLRERLDEQQERAGRPRSGAFLSIRGRSGLRSFGALRKVVRNLLYDVASGRGLVPYNVGALADGELHAVLIGAAREDVLELRDEMTGAGLTAGPRAAGRPPRSGRRVPRRSV